MAAEQQPCASRSAADGPQEHEESRNSTNKRMLAALATHDARCSHHEAFLHAADGIVFVRDAIYG
eukprot:831063-Prymnesium_polylepis.1